MEETQLEQTESIELELTAKGLYKWTIKVRDKTVNPSTIERLEEIDKTVQKKFPNNVLTQAKA